MAGTYTKTSQTVFGNKKVFFYTVTNYTTSETLTIEGMTGIDIAIPTTSEVSATVGYTKSGNVLTFVNAGTGTYDGYMMVIGW